MSNTLSLKPIQVGLLGIGTVGGGTFRVLQRNQEEIKRRAGRGIEIGIVAARDLARARSVVGPDTRLTADPFEVVNHPDVEIAVSYTHLTLPTILRV